VALRAGVELDPAACWLLARLSEHAPGSLSTLADRAHVEVATLDRARDRLLELGLIVPEPGASGSHEPAAGGPATASGNRSTAAGLRDATLTYGLTAAGHSTLERLKATGEERLTDLLECWRPDQHADLARFIANLAHEFFIDDSALREGIQAPATAVAS
jgi:DNA-binding MarR family transcriptional regulator